MVLPVAPGTAGGLGGPVGVAGRGGTDAPGPAAEAARGLARICFTCSINFPESNGLGMCPFAPTAMALAGSTGFPPPSSNTGMFFRAASALIFSHSS
jgi:hypothetical protein